MRLIATHRVSVTATPAPLPPHGGAAGKWSILIRNAGENPLAVAADAATSGGFSLPAGAALRVPADRPEGVFLRSEDGATAELAYFA